MSTYPQCPECGSTEPPPIHAVMGHVVPPPPASSKEHTMTPNTTTPPPVPFTLVGRDGNAFFLMGAWQRAARDAGWTDEQVSAVLTDAQSGDYDHLLSVLMDNSTDPDSGDEWEDES